MLDVLLVVLGYGVAVGVEHLGGELGDARGRDHHARGVLADAADHALEAAGHLDELDGLLVVGGLGRVVEVQEVRRERGAGVALLVDAQRVVEGDAGLFRDHRGDAAHRSKRGAQGAAGALDGRLGGEGAEGRDLRDRLAPVVVDDVL